MNWRAEQFKTNTHTHWTDARTHLYRQMKIHLSKPHFRFLLTNARDQKHMRHFNSFNCSSVNLIMKSEILSWEHIFQNRLICSVWDHTHKERLHQFCHLFYVTEGVAATSDWAQNCHSSFSSGSFEHALIACIRLSLVLCTLLDIQEKQKTENTLAVAERLN